MWVRYALERWPERHREHEPVRSHLSLTDLEKRVSRESSRWGFLIVEAVLIVASILLAFAIDAWWDDRRRQTQQDDLLSALEADFRQTLGALDVAILKGDSLVAKSGGYLDAVRRDPSVSRDSLAVLFNAVGDVAFFSPTLPSYRTAIATGSIDLIRSPDLIRSLGEFDLALALYELHLGISAELFYLGPNQDFRRIGGSFDDPEARRTGGSNPLPDGVDLRGRVAESTAEPTYTVQINILNNLRGMRAAASDIIDQLARN